MTALLPPEGLRPATEGLLVPPGHGKRVRTPAQDVTFKVTGEHSRAASTFEVLVPPGFDVGAHVHTRSEELFYVLEGELDVLAFEPRVRTPDRWQRWESSSGSRVVRATPGTLIVVPRAVRTRSRTRRTPPPRCSSRRRRRRTTNATSTNCWRSSRRAAPRTTRRSRPCAAVTTSSSSPRCATAKQDPPGR